MQANEDIARDIVPLQGLAILYQLKTVLQATGPDLDCVVQMSVYLQDLENFLW